MIEDNTPTLVAGKDIYHATATWGERAETAEALAARWIALIARLEAH